MENVATIFLVFVSMPLLALLRTTFASRMPVRRPSWARVFAVGVERAYLNLSPVGGRALCVLRCPARQHARQYSERPYIERSRTGGTPWAALFASVPAIP